MIQISLRFGFGFLSAYWSATLPPNEWPKMAKGLSWVSGNSWLRSCAVVSSVCGSGKSRDCPWRRRSMSWASMLGFLRMSSLMTEAQFLPMPKMPCRTRRVLVSVAFVSMIC